MPKQRKTIVLNELQPDPLDRARRRRYRVVELTNSIEFSIDAVLYEDDIASLCSKSYWDVKVKGAK